MYSGIAQAITISPPDPNDVIDVHALTVNGTTVNTDFTTGGRWHEFTFTVGAGATDYLNAAASTPSPGDSLTVESFGVGPPVHFISSLSSSDDSTPFSIAFTAGSYDVYMELFSDEDPHNVISLTSTPLPAALPLVAGGLGLLGMFSRRRKQKASAIAAA
jgi:hypothetical protein